MDKLQLHKTLDNKLKKVRKVLQAQYLKSYVCEMDSYFKLRTKKFFSFAYLYHYLFDYLVFRRYTKKFKKHLESIVMTRMANRCQIFRLQKNQRDLEIAIKREEYEEAARLRDLIKQS